ncbi:MAG TPA: hypothetical protein VHY09_00580 [Candidatus Methylacidiphilales bacterium]|jgi:hypothetical protein|nr:hypothetical protein [Candidatus Methylacidiphilales bacterium]
MTLAEIMQKITELSPADRAILRRELEETLSKPEMRDVSAETAKALNVERRAAGDERGLPIEDVIEPPKPKN